MRQQICIISCFYHKFSFYHVRIWGCSLKLPRMLYRISTKYGKIREIHFLLVFCMTKLLFYSIMIRNINPFWQLVLRLFLSVFQFLVPLLVLSLAPLRADQPALWQAQQRDLWQVHYQPAFQEIPAVSLRSAFLLESLKFEAADLLWLVLLLPLLLLLEVPRLQPQRPPVPSCPCWASLNRQPKIKQTKVRKRFI